MHPLFYDGLVFLLVKRSLWWLQWQKTMGLLLLKLASCFYFSIALWWLLADTQGPADTTLGSWIGGLEFDSLLMLPIGPYIMQDNFFLSSQPSPNVQVSGKGCPFLQQE